MAHQSVYCCLNILSTVGVPSPHLIAMPNMVRLVIIAACICCLKLSSGQDLTEDELDYLLTQSLNPLNSEGRSPPPCLLSRPNSSPPRSPPYSSPHGPETYVYSGPSSYSPTRPPSFSPSGPSLFSPSGPSSYSPSGTPSYPPNRPPLGPSSYSPTRPPSFSSSGPSSYSPTRPPSFSPSGPSSYPPSGPSSYSPTRPPSFSPSGPSSYSPLGPASFSPSGPSLNSPSAALPYPSTKPSSFSSSNPAVYSPTGPASYSPSGPSSLSPLGPSSYSPSDSSLYSTSGPSPYTPFGPSSLTPSEPPSYSSPSPSSYSPSGPESYEPSGLPTFSPTRATETFSPPSFQPLTTTFYSPPPPATPPSPPRNTEVHEGDCQGECVPFYLCKDDGTVNEDGEGIIDIKIPQDEGSCPHYLDKCCFPSNKVPAQNYTPPTPTRDPWACGERNPEGVGFKITGDSDNEANYGEFPWMVALLRNDEVNEGVHIKVMECGGSIIHPQVVLTAAHCVKGKKNLLIRAGEWDSQTEKEIYPTQEREVLEVIMHEGYYGGALFNDMALLVLESPLESSPVVSTICLPEHGEDMDNRHCLSSGWGKNVFGKEGRYQTILKRVELDTVPRDTCQEELRKTRLGSHFKLHPSFLCAGGKPGKDTCKGDGGGPLVCPSKHNPNTYVQAGIVAWGIGCGNNTPAVYANVPLFREWIDLKLEALKPALSKNRKGDEIDPVKED